MVQVSFGFNSPTSVSNMFGNWLNGFNQKLKHILLVGPSAICWLYGLPVMMLFLIERKFILIYRFYSEAYIGIASGPPCEPGCMHQLLDPRAKKARCCDRAMVVLVGMKLSLVFHQGKPPTGPMPWCAGDVAAV